MFKLNKDDLSIYVTRGDVVLFDVTAKDGDVAYLFKAGDVVRFKVFTKKNAEDVVLQRDFPVYEECEAVEVLLTGEDTKIGGVISKPVDYWYEVEVNPESYPQTIIGYNEDGAKVFRLFPEGADLEDVPITEKDIPIVDRSLDATSTRPVENQAIARAVLQLESRIDKTNENLSATHGRVINAEQYIAVERARIDSMIDGGVSDADEVVDGRVSNNGRVHSNIGNHIRDVNNQLDEMFDNLTIEGYSIADFYRDVKRDCEKVEGYFFRVPDSDMREAEEWNCYTLAVQEGEKYHINTYTVSAGAAVAFMTTPWDSAEIDPASPYYPSEPSSGEIIDIVVTVPKGTRQMLVNENVTVQAATIEKYASKKFEKDEDVGDGYLKGKKLVCCGDSITEAVNPDGGYYKNYAELVAERCGMSCYKDGVGGSTMAIGNGKSFSVDRYKSLPAFDYLTIWFGWNDAAYSMLGTIDDVGNSTFYGAYKMVLEYLVTNNPTKKIGVVVPYGSDSVNPFAEAVREVSAMYGVPCLDLKDGNKCSLIWGTANVAQTARRNALTYDGTHPNQDGYEFLSTMYENFLRSL